MVVDTVRLSDLVVLGNALLLLELGVALLLCAGLCRAIKF